MTAGTTVYVIDTSSIIHIRRLVPRNRLNVVFDRLDELVQNGLLVYPKQVVDELERYTDSSTTDLPYTWAKKNGTQAARHGLDFNILKQILNHPQVKRVLDPEKTGVEEADPYILALAVFLKRNNEITVISEERKDRPDKLSMNTACGLLRLYCLPIESFLAEQGIWPVTE